MEEARGIARSFALSFTALVVICALVRLFVGPAQEGIIRLRVNGQGSTTPGISDSLWAIVITFLGITALGIALVASARRAALRGTGSLLLGTATAMVLMYMIEVTAFPWNTYDVTWDHLIDFWGLFFGGFLGVSVFGLVHASASRRHSGGIIGLVMVGLSLGTLGLLTLSWAVMWRLPLLTLEGAWIYPLAFLSLSFSFLAFRAALRRRRYVPLDT
jgi:hypothetical protein